MNKLFFENNRKKFFDKIKENSIVVLFSGRVMQKSADQDFPFEVNKNFYYLTGINQADVTLLMIKSSNKMESHLFIEENDATLVKWVGKKLEIEEAKDKSGILHVHYSNLFDTFLFSVLNGTRRSSYGIENAYLDLERRNDVLYSNLALNYSNKLMKKYPELKVKNAYNIIVSLRELKSKEEVELIEESIQTTKTALEDVLRNLKAGMYEYQIEAVFDFHLRTHGQKENSFSTICGTGKNATILHYVNNNTILQENDAILFDLGCRTEFYISDISRTYPVSGKFTPRQKQIYEIVLNTNKECIKFLKPGITWNDYNEYANKLLADGLKKIGLINKDEDLIKYYWHSIGHSIGLDTHDPSIYSNKFTPGMVVTVEPGLYLEDEGIGVRIEDNVLITENGSINLSKDIIKEIKDIEAFMERK